MKWYQHPAIQLTAWWVVNAVIICLLIQWFGIIAAFVAPIAIGIYGLLVIYLHNNKRIKKAIEDLQDYGCDAQHHMQYGIDQTLRDLMGMEAYERWRAEYALNDYIWDEGVAP